MEEAGEEMITEEVYVILDLDENLRAAEACQELLAPGLAITEIEKMQVLTMPSGRMFECRPVETIGTDMVTLLTPDNQIQYVACSNERIHLDEVARI